MLKHFTFLLHMKVALFVTGGVRSFACEEQIACFRRILNVLRKQGSVDTFLCLGLREERENCMVRSRAGLENLRSQLQSFQPRYVCCFHKTFQDEGSRWSAINQVAQIGHARRIAGDNYDWYIRWRPDYACTKFDINLSEIDPLAIHTCVKHDAKGSDMVMIFSSQKLEWWCNVCRMQLKDKPLEYQIFENVACRQRFEIVGGLYRCFKDNRRVKNIAPWDKRKLFDHNLFYESHDDEAHAHLFTSCSKVTFDEVLEDIVAEYDGVILDTLVRNRC